MTKSEMSDVCAEIFAMIEIERAAAYAKGRNAGREETFHLIDLARKECANAYSRGLEKGAKFVEAIPVEDGEHLAPKITAAAIRSLKDD